MFLAANLLSPLLRLVCSFYLFICVCVQSSSWPGCVQAHVHFVWYIYGNSVITLNHPVGPGHGKISSANKLGYPLWSRVTCIALHLHGDVFRPDSIHSMTKYIERDLLTKESVRSACGRRGWSRHVSQGSLQWDPRVQAERGAEAGSLPQYPAEAGGRNQGVPPKPHQLSSRKFWSLQTSRAAEFGRASSSSQPLFSGSSPAERQHGLQVGCCVSEEASVSLKIHVSGWMLNV